MTTRELRDIFDELDDTHELVLPHPGHPAGDPLLLTWRAADQRAGRLLAAWRCGGGAQAYARYRAAADQADAAQDALAACTMAVAG